MKNDTERLRRKCVTALRATFAIDDALIAPEDLAWEERYIAGTASRADLLLQAPVYAKACRNRESAVNFARASLGLEGLTPTIAEQVRARNFINGEISLADFMAADR
jgi:hypothetical protein